MNRSPETQGILRGIGAILRREVPPADLLSGADPAGLLREAERHQVEGLFWEALDRGGLEERLPRQVRDALLLRYHRNGLRNAWIREFLETVVEDLHHRGVEVMLLKGAVLAFGVYDRPEHRGLGDVDFLVREEDFRGLRAALEAFGYRTALPALETTDLPRFAHCVRQVRFAARQGPPVEVHFRLLNLGLPPPVEPAWDTAVPFRLGTAEVRVPSPERFLLHLCLHAQQHAFALLRLFADLTVWSRQGTVETGRFVALARLHRLTTASWLAVRLSEELLGPPSGGDALRIALRPSFWKRALAERVWRISEARRLAVRLGAVEAELPRAFLLGEAPWTEKLAFLWQVAFPPRQWLPAGASRRKHLFTLLRAAGRELRQTGARTAEEAS